ncbi:nucleoside deaminase [Methanobacterium formicicum]|mgnify:FL=1|jgi:cytosine deaminase|uniref:Cytosine deaminase n=1 Tax=Methanobacterium formicicum TaxID=2162 RepID=A0A090I5X4_METFO|nr:nucleoside deaminase [Methanobacterium formicicum]MBF4476129.1 nucleoside deaminase [Methanobacterium formicicum]MDH2658749.1 nucleoside deaminase [Methanobacterium formicicum]CEA12412.1 cytosine deaminase [Methanobacterium formicicum]
MKNKHQKFMEEAYKEAQISLQQGGIPIGAILVRDDEIIGRGHNKRIQHGSSILHAEMDCLENAGRLRGADYKKCTIYTTLSPCVMCSGAIILYQIPQIVIGENENFKGPEQYIKDNGVELINLNLPTCKEILKNFIENNPELWNEDIGI